MNNQELYADLSNRLDNALVRQKDQILQLINKRKYEKAYQLLTFLKPFWEQFSYGYKYDELMTRLKEAQK